MVWLETPTNPMLSVFDIKAISDLVHELAAVVVDNTYTPYLQQPLSLGADVVVHSATKYLVHSDVVGASLRPITRPSPRTWSIQNAVGAVPSPFDCYLAMRGVKTPPYAWIDTVTTLSELSHYCKHMTLSSSPIPGTTRAPGSRHRAKQMKFRRDGCLLEGGQPAAKAGYIHTIFTLAESLGAVESLIEHQVSCSPFCSGVRP